MFCAAGDTFGGLGQCCLACAGQGGGESVCKGTDKTHLVGALVSKCLLGPLDPVFDVDHDSVSDLKSGRFL